MVATVGMVDTAEAVSERNTVVESPATDLWRQVRQRQEQGEPAGLLAGTTQMKGVEAGVLIRSEGQVWREFRMKQLVPYSMTLLGLAIVALAAFRVIRGKMMVTEGMSGVKIPRFNGFQRIVHWVVAVLFVMLALTGTLLTFGRTGLVPYIGNEAFGILAYAAKRFHDFAGPVFGLSLLVMIISYLKDNIPKGVDFVWFFKLGGFFGGHASSGRYNGGEKAWYWIVVLIGAAVVGSGLVLDFPMFGQTRDLMSDAHMVHSISAILILAASLGHIYMATIGTEGALETMVTGYCDENWAKEHHDLWYEEMKAAGKVGAVKET
jgi:formate dehydrogenase subunit gamma